MERKTFLLQILPGKSGELTADEKALLTRTVTENGGNDFSVWQAENMIFGYFETEKAGFPDAAGTALRKIFETVLSDRFLIISVCNMRLMYTAVNRPLTDKSKVAAHRVFLARLKPGCSEEYLRRHHGLEIAAEEDLKSGKADPEKMPSSNMTIWNGGEYICGYNEMETVPAADDPNSGGNEAWELNMLKIMDWLTNDADCFSGLHHEPICRLI